MRIELTQSRQAGWAARWRVRLVVVGLGLTSLGAITGCDSVDPETALSTGPFVVSSPVHPAAGAQSARQSPPDNGVGLVYLSLPPVSIPGGVTASIRDTRNGNSVSAAFVTGGFDPVSLPGALGDTIVVVVQQAGSAPPMSFVFTVPAHAPPVVVRTSPPPHKRDVPLNARIVVVFSEPIDQATLTESTFKLRSGSTVVGGQLHFTDSDQTSAEFIPSTPLSVNTDYQLEVTRDIHDLSGESLATPMVVEFFTGSTGVPLPTGPFLVSRAVPYLNGSWAFVSAAPGTIQGNTWVSVANSRTGEMNNGGTRNGGFDPIALGAAAGDTIIVTLNPFNGGPPLPYAVVVPATSVPRVLRSSPLPGEAAVWVSSDVTVVFTEPIDVDSFFFNQTASAQLFQGGNSVNGQWWSSFSGGMDPFWWTFVPGAQLSPGAAYELVLSPSITGAQGGAPMAAPVHIPFVTEAPPSGASLALLTVQSFGMIEYQYPTDSTGQWFYAPQLQLAETGGQSGATVIKMIFTVPGFGPTPDLCSAGTPVAAGQSATMFGVAYGDYEWAYFSPGNRAAAGAVTAAIVFRDDAGRTDTLTAQGSITPGGLPTTYYDNPHPYFTGTPGCQPFPSPKRGTAPSPSSTPSSPAQVRHWSGRSMQGSNSRE